MSPEITDMYRFGCNWPDFSALGFTMDVGFWLIKARVLTINLKYLSYFLGHISWTYSANIFIFIKGLMEVMMWFKKKESWLVFTFLRQCWESFMQLTFPWLKVLWTFIFIKVFPSIMVRNIPLMVLFIKCFPLFSLLLHFIIPNIFLRRFWR